MAFTFAQSVDYLVDIGVYDVILPFLLIFAIIFAILEKTKILGQDKTNINVIVSLVVGLLLIAQKGIVDIINLFLPRISLIIIVLLMGLLVIAMVAGKEFTGLKGGVLGFAIVLIIIAIIISLTSTTGGFSISESDKDTLLRVGIPLIVVIAVIWIVASPPKKEKNNEGWLKKLAEGFGGDK